MTLYVLQRLASLRARHQGPVDRRGKPLPGAFLRDGDGLEPRVLSPWTGEPAARGHVEPLEGLLRAEARQRVLGAGRDRGSREVLSAADLQHHRLAAGRGTARVVLAGRRDGALSGT